MGWYKNEGPDFTIESARGHYNHAADVFFPSGYILSSMEWRPESDGADDGVSKKRERSDLVTGPSLYDHGNLRECYFWQNARP